MTAAMILANLNKLAAIAAAQNPRPVIFDALDLSPQAEAILATDNLAKTWEKTFDSWKMPVPPIRLWH